MTFNEHATTLGGKQVVDFELGGTLPDPATSVPALRCDYEDEHSAVDLLSQVLEQPNADQLTGLVIGAWAGEVFDHDPGPIVEALVASAGQLPNLTALFIGDMTYEENEVSWIQQSDLSPLLTAFDRLRILQIRGSNGLTFGNNLRHDHLQVLTIESGGLPTSVLKEIDASQLPMLEHLELYLGTENYGWDGTAADLNTILSGDLFPKLLSLGLKDSEIADDVAEVVAQAPILERIKMLDLSLGTLTDRGGEALLNSPAIAKLQMLDLHHHYLSDEMMKRFEQLPCQVNLNDQQQEDDGYRYVAVSE